MSNDPHALRPGASIAGYNIIRVLGVGGFGITYEADSPFTGKRVAIKEFFPRGIASREGNTRIIYAERDMEVVQWALKRFESSTLDQCRLDHPNIVDVIHYVKDNGTGYMIMEYVEGETLEHWLREGNRPPAPEELRLLMEPVLSALEYLHSRKMIHRDIAPDNIMVRADGRPMIIDFGAIKLIEQETQIRSNAEKSFMVAKQFYSPPEQIQDDGELDSRADIYATGAVLYRAFAGHPPVSAEERMQKLAFGKPDPLTLAAAAAPRLPRDLAAAIDRALSFNADNRQATIAELREALGWDEGAGLTATVALPRDADDARDDPVPKRSKLPWLLPLAGIAAILAAIVFGSGLVPLSKLFAPQAVAPAPVPKLDEVKVVPQMPVHTPPPEESVKKEENPKQQAATPPDQQSQTPPAFPKWFAGEVTLYRAVPNDPALPLTTCVIGRRLAFIVLVEGSKLRVSQGANTFFIDLQPDGSFDFESAFTDTGPKARQLLRKIKFAGTITPERMQGDFVSSIDLGSCHGKFTAKPATG
ncbi:MAG: serine/threonine protein kinase [Xanthobacteraceae bacterium]|nr:serine/threonine protein kinase [Xanthobacteraceae bacterium]